MSEVMSLSTLAFSWRGISPPTNRDCGAGGSCRPAYASKSRASSMYETCQWACGRLHPGGGIFSHWSSVVHRITIGRRSGPHRHSLGMAPSTGGTMGTPRGCGSCCKCHGYVLRGSLWWSVGKRLRASSSAPLRSQSTLRNISCSFVANSCHRWVFCAAHFAPASARRSTSCSRSSTSSSGRWSQCLGTLPRCVPPPPPGWGCCHSAMTCSQSARLLPPTRALTGSVPVCLELMCMRACGLVGASGSWAMVLSLTARLTDMTYDAHAGFRRARAFVDMCGTTRAKWLWKQCPGRRGGPHPMQEQW